MYLKTSEIVFNFIFITEILCRIESNKMLEVEGKETNKIIVLHENNFNTTSNSTSLVVVAEKSTQNVDSTINNNSTRAMKRRKRKRRRRRKNTTISPIRNSTISSAFTANVTKTLQKRTKRKKKRKNKSNNILEVTTARNNKQQLLNVNRSSIVDNLINKLNDNPEIKLNELKRITVAKTVNNRATNNSQLNPTIKKRNRCAKNNGGCSQICQLKSKRKCFCFPGYKQAKNRKKCVDINECLLNNGGCQGRCENTPGAHYCNCPSGLTLSDDLKSCRDINECLLRNGHGPCQDTCRNTHGSYSCDCSNLNGTKLGIDGHSCLDIDECVEGKSGCSHTCINTLRGVFCSCPEGMLLSSDWKTCQDINECEDETIKKFCQFGCVNTIGSYYCSNEFQNDQIIKMTFCPKLNPPAQGFIKCFREKAFYTTTKTGRRRIFNGPETVCKLICPSGFKFLGNYEVTCGISGDWLGNRTGKCLEASKPLLKCPKDQEKIISSIENVVDVRFPAPETNLNWDYVKSNPPWAINLNGEIGEGYHVISFVVTDPITSLISTCSFSITIKRQVVN